MHPTLEALHFGDQGLSNINCQSNADLLKHYYYIKIGWGGGMGWQGVRYFAMCTRVLTKYLPFVPKDRGAGLMSEKERENERGGGWS